MVGATLAHYRLLEVLGQGGMGVVYKAQDTVLERVVALKVMRPELIAGAELRARFLREARSAAALNHPNIAQVYEAAEADGSLFMAMEFIPGRSLRARLATPMPLEEALRTGREIAAGLAHAHAHQIVHRDLKPENIILGDDGRARILDFGLAKVLQDRGTPTEVRSWTRTQTAAAELTLQGQILGTPQYMSPEQARGLEVDARSDIFSYGAILYEMVSGEAPFKGDTPLDVLEAVLHTDPVALTRRDPRLPMRLEAIVSCCLAKDPAQRPASGGQLLADLERIEARQVSRAAALLRRTRGIPTPRILLAAGAVVLLAAVGLHLSLEASHPKGPHRKTIAVLPFRSLTSGEENEYFSIGMTDDILTQLMSVADLKVISRRATFLYKDTRKSSREIGHELKAGVILEGSIRRLGDEVRVVAQLIDTNSDQQLWAETYDREYRQIFTIQSEIAQKIASSLRAKLTPAEEARIANPVTTKPEAYTAYLQGRFFADRRSKEDLEKAIGFYEEALRIDAGYARSWVGLSKAHSSQADAGYVPVGDGYARARAEAQRALALDPTLAEAHAQMGWIKRVYDWDWSGADRSCRRALELEPGNAMVISEAALFAWTLGRYEEAMKWDRQAIELDPLRISGYFNLGSHAYYAGLWEEAKAAKRKVLELNPQYVGAHLSLGQIYLAESRPEQALAEIQKEPEVVWRMFGLALVYHALGRTRDADGILAEFIARYQDEAAYQVAMIYAYRGHSNEAFEWLERAYRQRDTGLSEMKGNPLLRNVEKDPRYVEFMKQMKLPV